MDEQGGLQLQIALREERDGSFSKGEDEIERDRNIWIDEGKEKVCCKENCERCRRTERQTDPEGEIKD